MAGTFREQVIKRFTRSSGWSKVRSEHLKKNGYCKNCGKRSNLQVHHIIPFQVRPDWELEPTNLITLCGNPRCHLDKGHAGDFKSWNVNVVTDCKIWFNKYINRPYKININGFTLLEVILVCSVTIVLLAISFDHLLQL